MAKEFLGKQCAIREGHKCSQAMNNAIGLSHAWGTTLDNQSMNNLVVV